MRLISLFLFYGLLSCSHFNSLRAPASENLSLSEKRSLVWNSAYRMVMDERPDLYDDLKGYEQNLEMFYEFLGKADRGEIQGLKTPLKKRGSIFSSSIINTKLPQASFETWQEMEEERLNAYFNNRYVFSYKDKVYTLWGSELTEKNIAPYILSVKKQMLPGLSNKKFLVAFFNHQSFLEIEEGRYFSLPQLTRVRNYNQRRFEEDFNLQTGLKGLEFTTIANGVSSPLLIEGFSEYFSSKNYLMLRGQLLDDYNNSCETKAYVRSFSMRKIAREFLETLLNEKSKLMRELSITNNEYNEMMALAVGILAVESKLGTSLKYKFKEDIRIGKLNLGQALIKRLKRMRGRNDENSRGLTQIKNIGPLLEDTSYAYLENADLDVPKHAAIATMFVLKEKFGYLMHFRKSHPHIDDFNWPDYLYYFYQGASRQITKGTATPKKNLRIRKIMDLREKMMIFEKCL